MYAGLVPDRFAHNALLEAHAAAGDLHGAAAAYARMAAAGVRPDPCTFIPLFQAGPLLYHLHTWHVFYSDACILRERIRRASGQVSQLQHLRYVVLWLYEARVAFRSLDACKRQIRL